MIVRQAVRFALVGVLGFLVDAGVLMLALQWPRMNFYSARVISFLAAVTATWALNRHFTFRPSASPNRFAEWLRFAASNTLGGLINFAVYAWLISSWLAARNFPVLAVAAGSLSGLSVNFSLSRLLVFRHPVPKTSG